MAAGEKTVPNAGMGGDLEHYSWSQTLEELNVTIRIPKDKTVSKKAVRCVFGTNRLDLSLPDVIPGFQLSGDFYKPVVEDECFWSIDTSDSTVSLHIEKRGKMEWWSCVVAGEPEIDVAKIEPGNSKLSDLDPEMRGVVEKMMFDQRQKAAGLPSSEDIQRQDMLKKIQEQHPEMDFSGAKFS